MRRQLAKNINFGKTDLSVSLCTARDPIRYPEEDARTALSTMSLPTIIGRSRKQIFSNKGACK
jgi:hypothetical protein